LTSVTFAQDSQLTSIGQLAFYAATALTSISIPASVTSIGNDAFYQAEALTSVTFEANSQLTSIGEGAFRQTTRLTSISIPAHTITLLNNAGANPQIPTQSGSRLSSFYDSGPVDIYILE
jgi:hypothetical protein